MYLNIILALPESFLGAYVYNARLMIDACVALLLAKNAASAKHARSNKLTMCCRGQSGQEKSWFTKGNHP